MDQRSDLQSENKLIEQIALLERRVIREKKARQEAEQLLESKSLELFDAYKFLESMNKSLEKNIERRTQTLMTLVNNLHAGVLLNDENGKIIFINEQFRKIFRIGPKSEKLIGMDHRQSADLVKNLFVNPDEFINILDKCIFSNEDVLNYELEMVDHRIIDCDFIPIRSKGDFVGHLWQVRDVTESREAQKKIAYSEEKYRGIIENMQLGLLEVDGEHIITRAYDSFCEMTGYTEEELNGKNAMDVFLPKPLHDQMYKEDEKRIKGQQSIYETRMIKKNGEEIFVLISGAPFYNEHGEMVGSIGIHYDITKRKKLEEELKEARNQADRSREAEKQFLANMSHEIRNPINAIIGMTNLIYDTKPTKAQLEYLDKIKFSSEILLGLISGILDISKIESGKFELVEREIDLKDTLGAIVDISGFRTQDRDVKIILKFDDNINFKVLADPTVINQIFLNLINNSLKFTEKGIIEVSGVLLEQDKNEAHFVFAVKDTGIGIPKDKLGTIFELFNQGDSQTKLKYGGTGLGLAIVKQLVEKYSGTIDVESEVGKGSIFQFSLKLQVSQLKKSAAKTYQVKSNFSHILIVEDNAINQQYLSGILKNWKFTYDIANNGLEALEHIESKKYDLVLMDIRMPLMDGYETTIHIRANHDNENQKVPIVALTASALVDEKEKALAVGMNYHVTKPFTPDQLANVLRQFGLVEMIDIDDTDHFKFSDELDTSYLNEFYGDDLERARMMFEIFLNTIDEEIIKMNHYFESEDWDKFASQAHKIKPNFAMVGLSDISETMRKYELTHHSESEREKTLKNFKNTLEKLEKGKKNVENELRKINQFT